MEGVYGLMGNLILPYLPAFSNLIKEVIIVPSKQYFQNGELSEFK
jgi:hypothetical protein